MSGATNVVQLNADLVGEIIGKPPLIEPGLYELAYYKHWLGYLFGPAPKLIIVFRVATTGPAFGEKILRCYNVKSFNKRRGTFRVGWRSYYVEDYSRLFGSPRNLKSVGINKFKGTVVIGKVRTVTKNSLQKERPECLHYSIVGELIRLDMGKT